MITLTIKVSHFDMGKHFFKASKMSLKAIKERVNRFLMSQTSEILSICGAWGMEKTFTWSKILKEIDKSY